MYTENRGEISCKKMKLEDMNDAYHWPLSTLYSHVPLVEALKMAIFGIFSTQQFRTVLTSLPLLQLRLAEFPQNVPRN